jgi:hypothetical protein
MNEALIVAPVAELYSPIVLLVMFVTKICPGAAFMENTPKTTAQSPPIKCLQVICEAFIHRA